MKAVDFNERLPIKMWLEVEDLGTKALRQVANLANLPFAFKHIALMPDAHFGYGMPIGGVLATKGVVIPNAVGVDIGCGMCAVKLPIKEKPDQDALKYIMNMIRKVIPVGFKKHGYPQDGIKPVHYEQEHYPIVNREFRNAAMSLGTLGGGNHFIEIQYGSDGHVWIMVHSGSRNLGKQVAEHYNKLAIRANALWQADVPKEWELAFLPLDTVDGEAYIREMNYCVEFALRNRKQMMKKILEIFYAMLDIREDHDEMINIAHNYAQMENHFGQNVMVHRKGATLARKDTIGIIPGSQGTASYIVKGKGNPDSFMSCSHGAGRTMGRNEARKKLDLQYEINRLNQQGVVHSLRTEKDLDEASGAYKDIKEVMENQEDLVEVLVELQPLAVIKG